MTGYSRFECSLACSEGGDPSGMGAGERGGAVHEAGKGNGGGATCTDSRPPGATVGQHIGGGRRALLFSVVTRLSVVVVPGAGVVCGAMQVVAFCCCTMPACSSPLRLALRFDSGFPPPRRPVCAHARAHHGASPALYLIIVLALTRPVLARK